MLTSKIASFQGTDRISQFKKYSEIKVANTQKKKKKKVQIEQAIYHIT